MLLARDVPKGGFAVDKVWSLIVVIDPCDALTFTELVSGREERFVCGLSVCLRDV